jgi:hypothetical protein
MNGSITKEKCIEGSGSVTIAQLAKDPSLRLLENPFASIYCKGINCKLYRRIKLKSKSTKVSELRTLDSHVLFAELCCYRKCCRNI